MRTTRLLPFLLVALTALALTGCDPKPADDANAPTNTPGNIPGNAPANGTSTTSASPAPSATPPAAK